MPAIATTDSIVTEPAMTTTIHNETLSTELNKQQLQTRRSVRSRLASNQSETSSVKSTNTQPSAADSPQQTTASAAAALFTIIQTDREVNDADSADSLALAATDVTEVAPSASSRRQSSRHKQPNKRYAQPNATPIDSNSSDTLTKQTSCSSVSSSFRN